LGLLGDDEMHRERERQAKDFNRKKESKKENTLEKEMIMIMMMKDDV